MAEKSGFEIMDTALFILTHAIEINIDLQQVIIDLSKKVSTASVIFKRIKPIWQYQKDTENVFWNKYPIFARTSTKDHNLFLKTKDFERFYSRVLEKILFKLAFHSVNAKPLIFTSSNLLELIQLAIIKKGTSQIQSLCAYIDIIKYILQENIAFQKLILQLMFDQNYITSIEMKKFERFSGDENLDLLKFISPFIEEYCNLSKERIFGYKTQKWKMPQQFMKMIYSGTPQQFVHYLEDFIRKETNTDMDEEQTCIYNKFVAHHKQAENHFIMQGDIFFKRGGMDGNLKQKKLVGDKNIKMNRRSKGSFMLKDSGKRRSLTRSNKARTEYKKSIILQEKELSILDDPRSINKSIMRVSTIKSRDSILNSLQSFTDNYNNIQSGSDLNSPPPTKTAIIQEQTLMSLIRLSHQNSRASIQIQTSPLGSGLGLGDNQQNFKKSRLNAGQKQNMFNKLRNMKAIGGYAVPEEKRCIKNISKLIGYEKQRIPTYDESEVDLRKSLMNKVLAVMGGRLGLPIYGYKDAIKDCNQKELLDKDMIKEISSQTGYRSTRKKSRFANQAELDKLKTEVLGRIKNQSWANSRSISVRINSAEDETKVKNRSMSGMFSRKGYDIYDTRSKIVIQEKQR